MNVWWSHPPKPDYDWLKWKNALPGRQIVISQTMVPNNAPSNWRQLGASGVYDHYATKLAANLVAEGLGDSVIRLGPEANDTDDPTSSLGSDPSQYARLGSLLGEHRPRYPRRTGGPFPL